ncbi:hypothetical protein KOE73_12055 [Acidomonas methanolica]|nr:hypothetical protein [Acidomonas methanolica]MBU2655094.1 hypothetical protein [Acidomonas methanolica]
MVGIQRPIIIIPGWQAGGSKQRANRAIRLSRNEETRGRQDEIRQFSGLC